MLGPWGMHPWIMENAKSQEYMTESCKVALLNKCVILWRWGLYLGGHLKIFEIPWLWVWIIWWGEMWNGAGLGKSLCRCQSWKLRATEALRNPNSFTRRLVLDMNLQDEMFSLLVLVWFALIILCHVMIFFLLEKKYTVFHYTCNYSIVIFAVDYRSSE